MQEKIIGYALLVIGLLLVCFSAVNAYLVFTGKALPIRIFRLPGISLDIGKIVAAQATQMPIREGLPENIDFSKILPQLNTLQSSSGKGGTQEIISGEMVNVPLNYFTHLMLMGFLLNVGVKIAGLGIQLVRPIIVKLTSSQEKLPKV